ncbi:MAG: flagellar basal body P-ring formation chaperone FlgA [bacterium]|jgi:flagella basal body P-ring formation protein FlgA
MSVNTLPKPLSDRPPADPDEGAGMPAAAPRIRQIGRALALACLLLPAWTLVPPAMAQSAAGQATVFPALHERIVQQVQRHLQEQTSSLPGEVRITVNAPDERTRLAGCDELQVSLAPGARAWGQVPVGVRCVRPQGWQIYVQATVRVSAPVVVAARPLLAGSVVDTADLTTRIEELTALPASVIQDPNQAVGRVAASTVSAGSVLRAENLKQVLAVVNGQTVRLVYESATLSVSYDGRALGNAAVGQGVDVRVGSGKVVRGIVRSNGVVVVQ